MTLLQEVDTIEQETIKPLDDCQKLIEHGVSTADDLVREGGSKGAFEVLTLRVVTGWFLRNLGDFLPSEDCLGCFCLEIVYNTGP